MANDSGNSKSASGGDDSKGKGKSNQAVVDYLQAPRKKRKSYVVMAASDNVDGDTVAAIQKYMRSAYSKLSFVVARSAEDFEKYNGRNIVLLIMDDMLEDREKTLEIVRKSKEGKTDGPMPTLFLTRDPSSLLIAYQKTLKLYHEVDEYIDISSSPRHAIFTKIKSGIDSKYQRRGRRYKVTMPVHFQTLDTGEVKFSGKLLDFSIYGALLEISDQDAHNFSTRDQLLLHLPVSQYLKGQPDVFRIAARVRRVLISGGQAGISWEYVSNDKMTIMSDLLTTIVDQSLAKSATATRAKFAKAQADQDLTRGGAKPPV
jgi:hypothetical protein